MRHFTTKPKVALVNCSGYEEREVKESLSRGFDLIGGLENVIAPNSKVLIKPNLMGPFPPKKCATTNPTVIKYLSFFLKEINCDVFIGDSPGGVSYDMEEVFEITGMNKIAFETRAKILNLSSFPVVTKRIDNLALPEIHISKVIEEIDVIISVPKLKTHSLTFFTGAMKNMFGLVPGFYKTYIHKRLPTNWKMSEGLVEIYNTLRPDLVVIDAIVGMEGRGASGGEPRKIGALIVSEDGVAADAIAAYLIGYNPVEIPMLQIAQDKGVGIATVKEIEVKGEDKDSIVVSDFKKPKSVELANIIGNKYQEFAIGLRPTISDELCKKCGVCQENCPSGVITITEKKWKINYSSCIRCFCCQELCPYGAIRLEETWKTKLAKKLFKIIKEIKPIIQLKRALFRQK